MSQAITSEQKTLCRNADAYSVVALIGTYRRFDELRRVLDCLKKQTVTVSAVVVADNAADESIKKMVAGYGRSFYWLPMASNRGCSAALKAAEEFCLKEFSGKLTHFLILDDDVAPPPDTLEKLIAASGKSAAALLVPILTVRDGTLFWPSRMPGEKKGTILDFRYPAELQNYCQNRLPAVKSVPGTCLLVKTSAIQISGTHRDDFWMYGDDLEFSERICHEHGGALVPDVVVPHLSPEHGAKQKNLNWRVICVTLLQNQIYKLWHCQLRWRGFSHLHYSLAIIRNYFLADWGGGCCRCKIRYAASALCYALIFHEPAGGNRAEKLRGRIAADFHHPKPKKPLDDLPNMH